MEGCEPVSVWKLLIEEERTDELVKVFSYLEGKTNLWIK